MCVSICVWEKQSGVSWLVSVTRRHTLNPCWCLFLGMCYCSKRSTHRWWHFLRSPILPLNWMKLNQSGGAAWSQPVRLPWTDPQHLLRGLHSSPAGCRWSPGVSGGPRQGCPLCPILFEWSGCGLPVRVDQKWSQEGSVCMCSVFLPILVYNTYDLHNSRLISPIVYVKIQ